MSEIQSVRGTHDLVGSDLLLYKKIEKNISKLAEKVLYPHVQAMGVPEFMIYIFNWMYVWGISTPYRPASDR